MLGFGRMQIVGAAAVVLLATHGATYVLGWQRGYAASEGRWARERLELLAAAEARARVLREQGDRLAAELEQARTRVRVEYVDRVRTVYRVAQATKECFSPDTTAALNRQPIREAVERPGEPPRVVEPPPAAGGTSELAAAEWIAGAQAAHEQCRAQVARLADWARAVTGSR